MEIIAHFPGIHFIESSYFAYDAAEDEIHYDSVRLNSAIGRLSLLHEISHYLLGHFHYNFDIELLMMEVAAWDKTRELAQQLSVTADEHYIADCIDSYDNWLTKRATCPVCHNFCLQQNETEFRCFVCDTRWRVSNRADARVVRRLIQP